MIRLQVLPVGIMRNRSGFQRAARVKRPRSPHTRPCSPDEATRNPGRSTAVAFLNTGPGFPACGLHPGYEPRAIPAFVARMKRSEIRGKSPWVAPRRKSPWAAIRHKHRHCFSQHLPRITHNESPLGGRPAAFIRATNPVPTRPCSPDVAKRNPGAVALGGGLWPATQGDFLRGATQGDFLRGASGLQNLLNQMKRPAHYATISRPRFCTKWSSLSAVPVGRF